MEEKKARKTCKAAKAIEKSPIVEHVCKMQTEPIVLSFSIDDQDYEVHIKPHVDFASRSAIMDNLESIYFPSGVYDPLYGDALLEYIIMQVYTDLEFSNDFDAFDNFRYTHGDIFREITTNMPYEVTELRLTIHNMLGVLLKEHIMPDVQKKFYENATSFFNGLRGLEESLVNVLNTAETALHDINAEDMKELVSAMSFAGKTDETRVARAILDFQKEKEKRVAVKTEPDASIPHI